jgi:putative DNA primase/helicase
MRYVIHVTFSAGNLVKVAAKHGTGLVIADRDQSEVGQKAAEATGLPYWISETVGFDLNDQCRKDGIFKTSQAIRRWINSQKGI